MRKVFLAVLASAALMAFGSAQKFSVYAGYPLGLGGMYYLSENLRVNGTLVVVPGAFGLGTGVDFILGKVPVVEQDPFPINFYYGAGGALSFVGGSDVSIFALGVIGFGGFEYRFSENLGLFTEFGAGPWMVFGKVAGVDVSGFAMGYMGRFGLNFY